jgi:RHS repeat-associated protein
MSNGKRYFPYGEERAVTAGSGYKFATYWRESASGLDYADQRWYSSVAGRFLTADPYQASGGVGNPGSWNRYGYVEGDPVNRTDRSGLQADICSDEMGDTAYCTNRRGHYVLQFFGYSFSEDDNRTGFVGLIAPVWKPDGPGSGGSASLSVRLLTDAWKAATKALQDPACGGLFNTDPNRPHKYTPGQVLMAIVFGLDFGRLVTNETIPVSAYAVTRPGPGSIDLGNGQWRANEADIVLQNSSLGERWTRQSPETLAYIFIHELGHVFSGLARLGGSKVKNDVNADQTPDLAAQAENARILAPCKRALGIK